MSLEKNMKGGYLYQEYGHRDPQDIAFEKKIEAQRIKAKELCFDFNHTRPKDQNKRKSIMKELLGSTKENYFFEGPCYFAYGCHTHIGDHFYANFNLSVVDDGEVRIGDYVMLGPNVMISSTGHPLYPEYRKTGVQFSLPVTIEDGVWIGGNVSIMPGVTIGENSVIGAGSVVTSDIPANCVAVGSPCKKVRDIHQRDKEYYTKERKINFDW